MLGRLHPTDAQTFWMADAIPSDQFLLFCFESTVDAESVAPELLTAAHEIPELSVKIADSRLGYPRTVHATIGEDRVVRHGQPDSWRAALDSVASLFRDQVDPRETPWKLHLFERVPDAPHCTGPALVLVLQISHTLGDGRVVSAVARRLLGDRDHPSVPIADRRRLRPREFVARASAARDMERRLSADTAAGVVPAQAAGRPLTSVNVAPRGATSIRTVVRERTDLVGAGVTVTVGALTSVSVALSRYLSGLGEPVPTELGAEVTLAKNGERRSRNHFRNAGVDLYPDVDDLLERAGLVASSLDARLARAGHPAMEAQSRAAEMVPAVLLRWGIRQFDAAAIPEAVTGNTVVSSVARGPADLILGGGPVRFTAGFPALSPVMGLTHGVHGIGDVVTFGVTSSESALPDPDAYASLLHGAVDDVARALHRTARSG